MSSLDRLTNWLRGDTTITRWPLSLLVLGAWGMLVEDVQSLNWLERVLSYAAGAVMGLVFYDWLEERWRARRGRRCAECWRRGEPRFALQRRDSELVDICFCEKHWRQYARPPARSPSEALNWPDELGG